MSEACINNKLARTSEEVQTDIAIPYDWIISIILYLPLDEIRKCRRLCKGLHALLTRPQFIVNVILAKVCRFVPLLEISVVPYVLSSTSSVKQDIQSGTINNMQVHMITKYKRTSKPRPNHIWDPFKPDSIIIVINIKLGRPDFDRASQFYIISELINYNIDSFWHALDNYISETGLCRESILKEIQKVRLWVDIREKISKSDFFPITQHENEARKLINEMITESVHKVMLDAYSISKWKIDTSGMCKPFYTVVSPNPKLFSCGKSDNDVLEYYEKIFFINGYTPDNSNRRILGLVNILKHDMLRLCRAVKDSTTDINDSDYMWICKETDWMADRVAEIIGESKGSFVDYNLICKMQDDMLKMMDNMIKRLT